MIVKVEIDLGKEFPEYDEEGVTIGQSIQDAITHSVVQKVLPLIRADSKDIANNLALNALNEQKEEAIQAVIDDLIKNKKVKKAYSGDQMLSYSEYIEQELERQYMNDRSMRNTLDEIVGKLSKQFSAELKNRYDILFASQIVSKLNEQGMLKEDVARILLGDGK
jgi:hypothetical protein